MRHIASASTRPAADWVRSRRRNYYAWASGGVAPHPYPYLVRERQAVDRPRVARERLEKEYGAAGCGSCMRGGGLKAIGCSSLPPRHRVKNSAWKTEGAGEGLGDNEAC